METEQKFEIRVYFPETYFYAKYPMPPLSAKIVQGTFKAGKDIWGVGAGGVREKQERQKEKRYHSDC